MGVQQQVVFSALFCKNPKNLVVLRVVVLLCVLAEPRFNKVFIRYSFRSSGLSDFRTSLLQKWCTQRQMGSKAIRAAER